MGEAFNQFFRNLYSGEDTSTHRSASDFRAAIDVNIALRGSAAPTADVLLERAFINSMISHEWPSDDNTEGRQSVMFITTHGPLSYSRHERSPNRNMGTARSDAKKECPICKEIVGEPRQCFAAPENGSAMTTCCVCGEEKDMRAERVTLACMHPLCKNCFDRMPVA